MILETFPAAPMATVPVPLNRTHARAPKIGADPLCAPSNFAAVTLASRIRVVDTLFVASLSIVT